MSKFKLKDSQVDGEQPIVVFEDGTEVPLDELGSGYMRQSDYTKKTQDLAEQRKALEAQSANQQIEQTVGDADPHFAQMTKMYLDTKMSNMKNIYGDNFDEAAVLNEAAKMLERGIDPTSIDFDSIHKSMAYQDTATIEAKMREKILAELAEQNVNTASIIQSMDGVASHDETHGLSPEEMEFCRKTNMSYEEYAKYK